MRNGLIKLIAVIWAVAAGPGTVGVAQAQPASRSQSVPKYPVKPVRMLGGAFGSPSDILARTLGPRLADLWGQPVVIENRPGA